MFCFVLSRFGRRLSVVIATCLLAPALRTSAQTTPPGAAPDVLVFTNGDQLTGRLVRSIAGQITFRSDMAGEISVPVTSIRELHTAGNFAVLRKDQRVFGAVVRPGTVRIADGEVSITSGAQLIETLPAPQLGYLIDEPTFRRETNPRPSVWYGWNGALSAGATLVRATQNSTTFNASAALIRTFPTVSYLPPRNRTTVDVSETFGNLRSAVIPQTVPASPVSIVKTSIFHADAEQDEFLSRRFFYLGEVAFDHNYALGLELQQVYGGGFGVTPILRPRQQLDLKVDVHYEKQAFINGSTNQDLIGSTFTEVYRHTLPRSIVFTEVGTVLPSWNNPNAYSANLSANLALPVFKRFAANINAADNFINNPSPGYRKSSFQVVTGISYTLH